MFGFKKDGPFFGLTGGWLTTWITIACATDMTLFGYDQAVFSGVMVTDDFLRLHNLQGPENTGTLATVSAIYAIGCFVGALVAFSAGEWLGRKRTILFGTTVMTVGAVLKTASYSLPMMFVGRIICGVGNGINTATAPIWQTETAQAKWRGKLVIIEMMMNIFGFCLCNWINFAMSFRSGSVAWRFPLAFQLVFNIILYATVPWLPESPRWLVAHDRHAEAVEIIAALEAKPVNDVIVATQLREIDDSVKYELQNMIRWRDLFRGKVSGNTKTIRRLVLGAGTQLMQQFEGINIMSYYLPTVLIEYVGLSNERARLLTAVNATTYFVVSCAFVPFVERWGRRSLMLLSTAGQGFCFLIVTILLRYSDETAIGQRIATASIPFFFLYYISFGAGMLGVPWLYPTEINSLPMRTKGTAIATATNWITNYIIVQITPIGLQNIGWRFWILFTVFNAVFLPVIYFLYPETANRTLEDIDLYYRHSPGLIVTNDKDAIGSNRPLKYVEQEQEEIAKTEEVGGVEALEKVGGKVDAVERRES